MNRSTVFFCRAEPSVVQNALRTYWRPGHGIFFLQRATLHSIMTFRQRLAFMRAERHGMLRVQVRRMSYGCAVHMEIQHELRQSA